MNHIIQKGTNQNVIFLLHGTGGNASDLLHIGQFIDANATLIGLEGRVLENGMRRFFRRYPDGSFDLDSLRIETAHLYEEIQRLVIEYNLQSHHVALLGYSNGANIAIQLWKEYETSFSLGILLHPSLGQGHLAFQPQKQLSLFLTSGAKDPYITTNDFHHLVHQAQEAKIPTKMLTHSSGHEIVREELEKAKEVYLGVM